MKATNDIKVHPLTADNYISNEFYITLTVCDMTLDITNNA